MNPPVHRRLRLSGLAAELRADDLGGAGLTLCIGDEQQSHVYTGDPLELRFDYLRRIANLAGLLAPAGVPLRVLHLGGGALTLARHLALARPGSPQTVIEYESDLFDFVTEAAPLPPGTELRVIIDDARAGLDRASGADGYDLIVADVYLGSTTPAHLTSVEFYREVTALLSTGGVLAVNVADDAGLPVARASAATLAEVFPTVLVTGAAGLTDQLDEGNAVLFASRWRGLASLQAGLQAAGPHPSGLVGADRLTSFIGAARPVRDAVVSGSGAGYLRDRVAAEAPSVRARAAGEAPDARG
ncbi:spermidine synthase [Subtercola boreus]|nr:fused MFS/spermidine synthase [Subtercola boreus]